MRESLGNKHGGVRESIRGVRFWVIALLGLVALCGVDPWILVYASEQEVATREVTTAQTGATPTAVSTQGRAPSQEPQDDPPVGRDLRLSRFFNRLGRSFYRLGHSDNVWPAVIGAGATGGAALLDDAVNDRITGERRVLKELGDAGARLNSAVLGGTYTGLLLTGYFTGHTEMYSTSQSLLQGLIVTQTIVQLSKRAVGRERPNFENSRSFPSGHTADMAMTATIVGHRLGKRAGIPVTVLAVAVAASRVEKHAHWLSDVAGGAAVGYIVGRTVLRSNGLFVRRIRSQAVTLTPVVQPSRLALVVTW